MSSQVQIDYLRKQLYLSARNCVSPQFRGDSETVREVRDAMVNELYGKPYEELTVKELEYSIKKLQDMDTTVPITFNQLKLIRYYSVALAIHEADMSGLKIVIDEIELTSEELRKRLRAMFEKKESLPGTVISHLYKVFINPLVNKWMTEAKYKSRATKPENFYYERLEKSQAQHLITRFAEYYGQVNRRDGKAHTYNYSMN